MHINSFCMHHYHLNTNALWLCCPPQGFAKSLLKRISHRSSIPGSGVTFEIVSNVPGVLSLNECIFFPYCPNSPWCIMRSALQQCDPSWTGGSRTSLLFYCLLLTCDKTSSYIFFQLCLLIKHVSKRVVFCLGFTGLRG